MVIQKNKISSLFLCCFLLLCQTKAFGSFENNQIQEEEFQIKDENQQNKKKFDTYYEICICDKKEFYDQGSTKTITLLGASRSDPLEHIPQELLKRFLSNGRIFFNEEGSHIGPMKEGDLFLPELPDVYPIYKKTGLISEAQNKDIQNLFLQQQTDGQKQAGLFQKNLLGIKIFPGGDGQFELLTIQGPSNNLGCIHPALLIFLSQFYGLFPEQSSDNVQKQFNHKVEKKIAYETLTDRILNEIGVLIPLENRGSKKFTEPFLNQLALDALNDPHFFQTSSKIVETMFQEKMLAFEEENANLYLCCIKNTKPGSEILTKYNAHNSPYHRIQNLVRQKYWIENLMDYFTNPFFKKPGKYKYSDVSVFVGEEHFPDFPQNLFTAITQQSTSYGTFQLKKYDPLSDTMKVIQSFSRKDPVVYSFLK